MVQVPRQEPRMVKLGHTGGVECDAPVADEEDPVRGMTLPDDGIAYPHAGDAAIAAEDGGDVAERDRRRHARTMRLRAGKQDVHVGQLREAGELGEEGGGYCLLAKGETETETYLLAAVCTTFPLKPKLQVQNQFGIDVVDGTKPTRRLSNCASVAWRGRVARNACGDVLQGMRCGARLWCQGKMIRGLVGFGRAPKRQRWKIVKAEKKNARLDVVTRRKKEAADEPMVHIDSE
ncbi:hypothetical protein B0H16DRAFT_1550807 [Mycena metata]|uniref:Uncharacterized protein n=1 Tax=Mycena metata TaxID=1033252 RepID=A0AAD7IW70_9AGAR|nr:hypothetical protein B0H16DRAFT_1550807 [Mycena metata]